MTDMFRALEWVMVGGVIWLAFVLQLVYRRVYREPFLRFWSLSFVVLAISLSGQLLMSQPSSSEIVASWIPSAIGIPQFPLIVLAALSLKPSANSARRQWFLLAGFLAGLFAIFLVTLLMVPDPVKLARDLRMERHVEGAISGAWFCIAFWRNHYLARTVGGRITALFTAFYALHHAAVAAAVLGLPPYPSPYSVMITAVAIALPFGVSAGMIVLASEAMIATSKNLRDSEERYRTLVETSPDGIIATDPSGTILMCNRHAAEIYGYWGAAELIGQPAPMLIAPADRERVRATIFSIATQEKQVGLECRILLRNGSERSAELSSAPLRAADGTIAGSVTITHDVTERKEADRALRAEREFSAHVIDAIPAIFFVLDRRGNFVRWNANMEKLIELPAGRLRETNALARIHPDDRRRVAEALDAVAANGSGDIEARGFMGRTQQARYFHFNGRRMESDGAIYVVGCGIDITERRESEAARARLESQLLQSQKLESIGRLAGGVAHDFNNHLTVINGYCDLMISLLPANDPNREMLVDVRRAGERAAALTRQLLAFGRKQHLSPSAVSLNLIVSLMETMLQRLVPENIEIGTVLAPKLGATMADTGQIEQVIMNLVVNARDAMPDGGRIAIATANVDVGLAAGERDDPGISPGKYVTLAVTDTGIGMDERTRGMIFEPFFTTKEVGKGTGLGLATVYGIVKQSGGAITVRSAPGEGSSFLVYLPRLEGEAAEASPAPATRNTRTGHGTVLLVEDQDAVRGLASLVLRSSGYRVIEASNGPQALALPDSQIDSVDLLISDMVMPGMSGGELAARLAGRRRDLRVLFISGYAPGAGLQPGTLDPGVKLLEKPFTPAQLTDRVDEVLSAPARNSN